MRWVGGWMDERTEEGRKEGNPVSFVVSVRCDLSLASEMYRDVAQKLFLS